MFARWMVVLLCCFLASSVTGQGWLVTRLWFENVTRGTNNAGALLAEPGDRIAIRFKSQVDPFFEMKWGTLHATLILDGLTLIGEDEANTWTSQVATAFSPGTWFPMRIFHQPSNGPMHDFAIEPSDPSYPLVAERGLYALIGATDRSGAQNADRKLFEFTVQPGSVGEELHWSLRGRVTGTGLSTRVIDSLGVTRDPADNFVRVVPEPASLWGLVAGLLLLPSRKRLSHVMRIARRSVGVVVVACLSLWPMTAPCAGYEARLWFQNLTTGAENPGDLIARPGDQIAIRFHWDSKYDWASRWSVLQVTLILDGLGIVSDADANTWAQQFLSALRPANRFPLKEYHQPSYGPLHDHAIEPSNPDYPWIADRGVYGLAGVAGYPADFFDSQLFQFTVQPGSEGQILDWALDSRVTEMGLSTRVLDYFGATVDVTDNRVVVVPEPGALGGLLGASLLSRLRRSIGYRRPGP